MDDFREAFRRYIPRGEYETFRADLEAQLAMNEELRTKQAKGKGPVGFELVKVKA